MTPPARWRTWVLTTAGIYPVITAVSAVTGPLLAALPAPLRFLLITPVLTAAMTWVVMPGLTRAFPRFLHRARPRSHTGPVTTWGAHVGEENARWLATECRTARLASEYRPHDRGGGRIEISALALGALRELGEEEDGYITDDGDGLRIWIGDDAFELEPA